MVGDEEDGSVGDVLDAVCFDAEPGVVDPGGDGEDDADVVGVEAEGVVLVAVAFGEEVDAFAERLVEELLVPDALGEGSEEIDVAALVAAAVFEELLEEVCAARCGGGRVHGVALQGELARGLSRAWGRVSQMGVGVNGWLR